MEQPNPHHPSNAFSSVLGDRRGPLNLAGRIDRFSQWLNQDFAGQPGDRDFWQALSAYARSDGFVPRTAARHQHGDQRAFAFKLALRGSSEAVAVFRWRKAQHDWIRVR
jgi:hypothetical protein